jgi:pyruvate-ferredoxin/flavodoxin oxidoreductase
MLKETKKQTLDGNTATAKIAYKLSETIAIYPITPSSPMGELADELSGKNEKNIFGTVPQVEEMQSEGGVAGAIHGMTQTGSLATTFTCSQGLLLMIPNMYKIAGELSPCVLHVAARSLASQALSVFGDHQDVMATRATGFAMLSSGSVQEAHDMALIAHLVSLESRIPFLHFFDGFRTSHEINKIELINDETIKELLNDDWVIEHRKRALNPDNSFIRGTAQNPDVYFQGRESVNKFYNKLPEITQKTMKGLEGLTGRSYHLFDYYGHPEANKVIILMGSGVGAVKETIEYLNKKGKKVGMIQVRLYRPFSIEHFIDALPKSVKQIAVLDRTKEPGAAGEPLYQDVLNALFEKGRKNIKVIGGRYGLSSKEFTPAMIKAVYEELSKKTPKNHFTLGINDDVTNTSLKYDEDFIIENKDTKTAIFFGLGSDGTVGANKNSIKIIGSKEDYFAQAYFVYDSKKAGSITESHLRFGKYPIDSTYLIKEADFVGCHQFSFLHSRDILGRLKKNGTLLLNSPFNKEEVWIRLPKNVQKAIIQKNIKLYVVDAYEVAKKTGMGSIINTIMQTCFFELANIIDKEEAILKIKESIKKTYSSKGEEIVKKNYDSVDSALAYLSNVDYPKQINSQVEQLQTVSKEAPDFVKNFTAKLLAGKGEEVPVSLMPCDGTFPSGTSKYEKRGISNKIAAWSPEHCAQCGSCVFACPHSAIRAKVYDEEELKNAPKDFITIPFKGDKTGKKRYTIQISPQDCTGCELCVKSCPLQKGISMQDKKTILECQEKNSEFFNGLGEKKEDCLNIQSAQFREPLFEFSGACVGCGEIPYLKLVTQLFGERMIVANATGCSSIYGGNLPTTPWSKNKDGRGPAWSNSLFEDNAEFGFGFKVSQEKQQVIATELTKELKADLGDDLAQKLIDNICAKTTDEIKMQRDRITQAKDKLSKLKNNSKAKHLLSIIDIMLDKSVWIIGGDGWAYDIGFGGLDHVIASGKNINIMVLDTEVYSNTGGQASKSTPRSAVAKFATKGKKTRKKDLGMIFASYGNVYVAQIAIRANPAHALKSIKEAEAYNGPSIILAYSSCIAHGIDLGDSIDQQKRAVNSGYWPLYRYNPALEIPMQLDSAEPSVPLKDYLQKENRFKSLKKNNPEEAEKLFTALEDDIKKRFETYKKLAGK